MTKENLFDALKINSDRHFNIIKKENSNLIKLLKKVKKQYVTKYKKGRVTKVCIIKVFDKCQKFIKDQEDARFVDLKKLVENYVQYGNNSLLQCYINVNKLDNNKSSKQISSINLPLVPVDEERDSLTNINKTLIAESDLNGSILELTTCINNSATDVANEAMDVVDDVIYGQCINNDNISNIPQLRVSLDDILQSVINENDEIMEKTFENNLTFDGNMEKLEQNKSIEFLTKESSLQKIINSDDIVNNPSIDSSKTSKMIDANDDNKTPSFDSSIHISNNNNEEHRLTKNNSMTSLTSSRNNHQSSGLYKSKFHNNYGSTQKLAIKPQVNSALKRKVEEVQSQKKILDEEKRRKIIEDLEKQELRRLKIAELKNCSTKTKQINQSKIVNAHSSKDPSKVMTSVSKIVTKHVLGSNRDLTKTEPRIILNSIKPVSSQPKAVTSAVKGPQRAPVSLSKNQTLTSTLKPINKNTSSAALTDASAPFKTPMLVKSKPILSESCRKIVVNHESYNLDTLDSDNSDEDDVPDEKLLPSWVLKQEGTLGRLSKYHIENTDPELLFYPPMKLKATTEHVFANYKYNVKPRKSSAVWKN